MCVVGVIGLAVGVGVGMGMEKKSNFVKSICHRCRICNNVPTI